MSIRAKYIKVKVDQNHLKITITEGCVVYNLISKDFHEKVESINNDTWIWIIEEGEIEDYKGKNTMKILQYIFTNFIDSHKNKQLFIKFHDSKNHLL